MGRGNAGKTGHMPPPQPQSMQIPVLKIVQYPQFGFTVERAGQDGKGRILSIYLPEGERLDFPFDEESSKGLSERLLAPSVPGAGGVVLPDGSEGQEV